ncbi:hypothetical protein KIPB_002276, partial [Kipferlia bialata]
YKQLKASVSQIQEEEAKAAALAALNPQKPPTSPEPVPEMVLIPPPSDRYIDPTVVAVPIPPYRTKSGDMPETEIASVIRRDSERGREREAERAKLIKAAEMAHKGGKRRDGKETKEMREERLSIDDDLALASSLAEDGQMLVQMQRRRMNRLLTLLTESDGTDGKADAYQQELHAMKKLCQTRLLALKSAYEAAYKRLTQKAGGKLPRNVSRSWARPVTGTYNAMFKHYQDIKEKLVDFG